MKKKCYSVNAGFLTCNPTITYLLSLLTIVQLIFHRKTIAHLPVLLLQYMWCTMTISMVPSEMLLIHSYQSCGIIFVPLCIYPTANTGKQQTRDSGQATENCCPCLQQPQKRLRLVSEGLAHLVACLTVFVRILPDRKAACNIFPSRDE